MKGVLKYKNGWFIEWLDSKALEFADHLRQWHRVSYRLSGDDVLWSDIKLIHCKEYEFELDENNIAHIINPQSSKEDSSMLSFLKKYIAETPRDQIKKEWEEVEKLFEPTMYEKLVTEILYKNSHDTSNGLEIYYDNIQKVIDLIVNLHKSVNHG